MQRGGVGFGGVILVGRAREPVSALCDGLWSVCFPEVGRDRTGLVALRP